MANSAPDRSSSPPGGDAAAGRIVIHACDDEPGQSEHLARLVSAWAAERGRGASVTAFTGAAEALFAQEDGGGADILLLDIQMPGMDGVTLARRLRASGSGAQIVFVTAFEDWLAEGYEVDALHYLMKPVDTKKLFAVLDKAAGRARRAERYVLLGAEGGTRRVEAGGIVYAEAFSHYVEIHAAQGVFRLKAGMGEVEAMLGDGFFRCRRSYIVNMRYVTAVRRFALKLEGGAELPLPRRLYNAANEAFINYIALGHPGRLDEYLDRLDEDLRSVDKLIKSGNVMVDAILNSKLSLAQNRGIAIDAKAAVPEEFAVNDADLCVVIGNLLDNAMEACAKLPEPSRFIRAYIDVKRGELYISVTNSSPGRAKKLGGRYISEKPGYHGLGLLRVDRIVRKYGGWLKRAGEDGAFSTEILLPARA
jgi:DNA-binding LytR/AlgR family response regulator